jgi:hypothetical protein
MPNSRNPDIFEKLLVNSVFDYRIYSELEQMVTVKGLRPVIKRDVPLLIIRASPLGALRGKTQGSRLSNHKACCGDRS